MIFLMEIMRKEYWENMKLKGDMVRKRDSLRQRATYMTTIYDHIRTRSEVDGKKAFLERATQDEKFWRTMKVYDLN